MKLEEILLSDDVLKSINENIDYILELIPELKNMIGFDHKNPHHHLDVWNHTLYALSISPKDIDIRLSLLLHDIGKPFSYQEVDNIRHYKNHPIHSEKISRKILERLGYNKEYIDKICYLILNHDNEITIQDIENNYDLEYKRFCIQTCDTRSHNPIELDERNKYVYKTNELFKRVKFSKYGKIVCAALLKNNTIYYTYGCHGSIFPLEEKGVLRNASQGFITENGYYVDRKLGLEIAIYYDQIENDVFYGEKLFSEYLKKEDNKVLSFQKKYKYVTSSKQNN